LITFLLRSFSINSLTPSSSSLLLCIYVVVILVVDVVVVILVVDGEAVSVSVSVSKNSFSNVDLEVSSLIVFFLLSRVLVGMSDSKAVSVKTKILLKKYLVKFVFFL
jgi:hypothetical protein